MSQTIWTRMLPDSPARRTALVVCAALAIYVSVDRALRAYAIRPSFAALEQQEARKDLAACIGAIEREAEHLHALSSLRANSDALCRFVESPGGDYVETHLAWKSLRASGIELLCVLDTGGRVIWGQRFDPAANEATGIEDLTSELVRIAGPREIDAHAARGLRGVVNTRHGALVAAAVPIRGSDGSGPPRGMLVTGRWLDATLVRRISEETHIEFTAAAIDDLRLSPWDRDLATRLSPGQCHLLERDEETLLAHGTIAGPNGKPALLVRASVPREITARGRTTATYTSVTMVLGGAALTALALASIMTIRASLQAAPRDGDMTETGGPFGLVALVAAAGIGLAVWAMLALRQAETKQISADFDRFAHERIVQLQNVIKGNLAGLHVLRGLYDASLEVDQDEFKLFAGIEIEHLPGAQVMAWVPLVPANERAGFERRSGQGRDEFSLVEKDKHGQLVPAGHREEYFPVEFIEPLAGNEHVVGWDLGSEPRRRQALERARDTGVATATEPLSLVMDEDSIKSIIIVVPIYRPSADVSTQTFRRENLRGFVLGAYRAADLTATALRDIDPGAIQLWIQDVTDPAAPRMLHRYFGTGVHQTDVSSASDALQTASNWRSTREIQVAGRRWAITCASAVNSARWQRTWVPFGVLGAGVVLTGLLSFYLWHLISQRAWSEAVVRAQTAELRAKEQDLSVTLHSIGDGVIATDARGRIKQMNPTAERLTGWSLANARGLLLADVLSICNIETDQREENLVEAVLRGEPLPVTRPVVGLRTESGQRFVSHNAAPMRDALGRIVGAVLVFRDVTEEHQLREIVRASEERMHLALLGANLGMWDWDITTGDVVYNDRWADMLGYRLDEIAPRSSTFEQLIHPEDLPLVKQTWQHHLTQQEPTFCAEFRMQHKSGAYRWILARGRVVLRGPGGEALRATGTHLDITDQKEAEEDLRDRIQRGHRQAQAVARIARLAPIASGDVAAVSRQLTELAAQATGAARASVWLFDDKGWMRCIDCFEAARRQHSGGMALTAHEVQGEFRAPGLQAQADPAPDSEVDEAEASLLSPPQFVADTLDAAILGSGKTLGVLRLEPAIKPHRWHQDEVGFAHLLADQIALTALNQERHSAEERLAERERLLRTVIDLLPQRVFWKDRYGRFLGANSAFLRDAGMTEIVGKTDAQMPWEPEQASYYRSCDRSVMATGIPQLNIIETQRTSSGEYVWLATNKVPLVDARGNIVGILGTYQDITPLKQAERELALARDAADAANRAKSQFLANMSHEIRTPMTTILGYAEDLLLEGDISRAPPQRIAALNTILRNGEHLLQVINNVLDLSKIEAGRMEVEQIRCSPIEILGDVHSMMQVRAVDKGLKLDLEFDGPLPEWIQSDPVRLRQILINMVENAVKFTKRGGVRIHTRLLSDQDQAQLQFTVSDTGVGMTEEQLSRLFVPFSQADASTTRQFGGTGLGLSISRRFAEMLGGTITAASRPSEGTEFKVTVATGPLSGTPVVENPAAAMLSRQPHLDWIMAVSVRMSARILLVEDGEDNREFISQLLRRTGADVELAMNGREGVDLVTAALQPLEAVTPTEPFDCVLMDLQMPVMDGYEAASRMRAAGYSAPIIALTAHAMSGDRDRCIQAGFTDYATKPIDRIVFFDTLRRHLPSAFADQPHPRTPPASADLRERPPRLAVEPEATAGPPPDVLVSERAGDPSMRALIARFLGRMPDRIESVLKALAEHDVQSLQDAAHKLKGAAGNYGFTPIGAAAAALEMSAETAASFERLKTEAQALVDLCRRALAGLPALGQEVTPPEGNQPASA